MRWFLSVVTALGLAVGSGWVAARAYYVAVGAEATTAAAEAPAPPPRPSSTPDAGPSEPAPPLRVFALAGGVRLRLPVGRPVLLAYHEASMRRRIALQPLGSCVRCRNRWKFTPPRAGRSNLEYTVMDSRGRGTSATSAIDVVVRTSARLRSPVTGQVRRIRHYRLYGRYPDVRMVINPEGRPDRLVVLIHLRDVRVRAGERVTASRTVLGRARQFPFESQVDRYVRSRDIRGRFPHVHIEVKRPPVRWR